MKRLIAFLLILLCSLTCACTTYKNAQAVGQAFRDHKEVFTSAANTFKELRLGGNVGYVHTLNSEYLASFCANSDTVLVEVEGLHVHSKERLSDEQVNSAVASAQLLMQEVKINVISFRDEYVSFILYDENTFSWDPTLVCWLTENPDELKIGYGEDVLHVEENWYACIIDR